MPPRRGHNKWSALSSSSRITVLVASGRSVSLRLMRWLMLICGFHHWPLIACCCHDSRPETTWHCNNVFRARATTLWCQVLKLICCDCIVPQILCTVHEPILTHQFLLFNLNSESKGRYQGRPLAFEFRLKRRNWWVSGVSRVTY